MNFELVRILADGEYHSGVDLGRQLGITRSAIWKNISQLEEFGLEVESVKGKGYRLTSQLDLLDQAVVLDHLSDAASARLNRLACLDTVASTSDYLKEQLESLPDGRRDICVAEQQSAGRGRRGRTWQSPYARNLYFSISCKMQGGFASLSGLSLAIGAGLAEALQSLLSVEVKVKWPNDLWIDGRKVAGILIDVEGEPEGTVSVIVGVGLNVLMTRDEGKEIDQLWTSLCHECSSLPERSVLFARVISSLSDVLDRFEHVGFAGFLDDWHRHDALLGCRVTLKGMRDDIHGLYRGVDALGQLILAGEDGVESVYSAGEVSLRRMTT